MKLNKNFKKSYNKEIKLYKNFKQNLISLKYKKNKKFIIQNKNY